MPKQAQKAEKQDENIVVGDAHGKNVNEQAEEARGEKGEGDKAKAMRNYSDSKDKQAEKLLEEAFPERRAVDLRVESRREFAEKFGIDPNRPEARFKVEKSDKLKSEKVYSGDLTLQSVHGETHEKIAFRTHEDSPRGEEYLFYVMKNAHPHAMREHFEIDSKNETDPNLRSRYE